MRAERCSAIDLVIGSTDRASGRPLRHEDDARGGGGLQLNSFR